MSTALTTPQPSSAMDQSLTGQQKAAIIVRLLLNEGSNISLQELSGNNQADMVHQMANMNHIDDATVAVVVQEFLTEFNESGLSFPGALEDSLDLMANTVSPEITRTIRREAGISSHSNPWEQVRDMEIDVLLPLMERESVEVGAVILSKLKVSTAAELLGNLSGEKARRITYAISLISEISPAIVRAIGLSISEQLDTFVDLEFDDGPAERVGAILNFSPATTREDMLDGLQQIDATFARQVRQAIFTFANIPERLSPRDVPSITRNIDPAELVTALSAAQSSDQEVVEFILSNMSKRMAEQIREEINDKGEIAQKDGDAAMTTVVSAIREMADAGEIFLVANEE